MTNDQMNIFDEAIAAIDTGNIAVLESLLAEHPELATERAESPTEGYFANPYLLWFVADNPIRIDKLPPDILAITRLLVDFVVANAAAATQGQLDYALGLVATGRIPRECGVQIAMMDMLIDAGAKPGGGAGALANGNVAAAEHLIKRGGKLKLTIAVGLGHTDDVARLAPQACRNEQLTALTTAAFYGKADMIALLLGMGIDPNGYPENSEGFHSHATPLHQAVASGSLESVKLLVEAGAKCHTRDKIYHGTHLNGQNTWNRIRPTSRQKKILL